MDLVPSVHYSFPLTTFNLSVNADLNLLKQKTINSCNIDPLVAKPGRRRLTVIDDALERR